jgi:hypothetical protein
VQIPEGFVLRKSRVTPERSVSETPAGFLVASFGYVGDDYARIDATFDEAEEREQRERSNATSRVVRLVDKQVSLPDLFHPDRVSTHELRNPIIWTSSLDGLTWALADPRVRAHMIDRFRAFAPRAQWLVMESRPPDDIKQQLGAAGVVIKHGSLQHEFLVEVEGPEDYRVAAFCGSPARESSPAPRPSDAAMQVAPYLVGQLSELSPNGTMGTLFDAILSHPAALAFRCNEAGEPHLMHFASVEEPLLPVYPDIATCMRVDRAASSEPAVRTMLPPADLFRWALDRECGVALGWYGSAATIQYLPLTKSMLTALIGRRDARAETTKSAQPE